jgi:hypothetical protein
LPLIPDAWLCVFPVFKWAKCVANCQDLVSRFVCEQTEDSSPHPIHTQPLVVSKRFYYFLQ